MPTRAPRVCRFRGCGRVAEDASGYCAECIAAGRNETVVARRSKVADPFYLGAPWRRFRAWWMSRHPLCARCGRPGVLVDHVVPISAGGARLHPSNVQTLCSRCHNRKTGAERSGRGGRVQSPRPPAQ